MTTFLITGAGSGLGRAVALAAVREGHTVVGTLRPEEGDAPIEADAPGRSYRRVLDVTDENAVVSTVDEIERDLAPIDVLVSNAGYGHEGLIEESSLADLRRQFEVNVVGAVAVIKAVLPHMRARRAGHIVVITSMGGLVTSPGLGFYHGSTYALEGIVETLGKEVSGLGIRVTAVEPGAFRTDWAGRTMVRAPRTIADYDDLVERVRQREEHYRLGDPVRAGRAVLDLVAAANPPAHLVLGSDAMRAVEAGRRAVDEEFRVWLDLTRSVDPDEI